ncbi:MAG: AbrB family transcriptional regulator [Candidatus Hydrogenedens sp.]|nr:AbrB family transcriptional regulator [Candidatus Hydrogenedens sp.]
MQKVIVSPNFEVVIPREIREQLGIKPGLELRAVAYGDRIEFIPVRSIRDLKGCLPGIDTSVRREDDRY